MKISLLRPRHTHHWIIAGVGLLIVLFVLFFVGERLVYADKIYPGVWIGDVDISGLRFDVAKQKVDSRVSLLSEQGIKLNGDGQDQHISLSTISFSANTDAAFEAAKRVGRSGNVLQQVAGAFPRIGRTTISPKVTYNQDALAGELQAMSQLFSVPAKDVRVEISGTTVTPHYDTASGRVVDSTVLEALVADNLQNLKVAVVTIPIVKAEPSADAQTVTSAITAAKAMLGTPLVLVDQGQEYPVTQSTIGTWIHSTVLNKTVTASVDDAAVSNYVATFAAKINRPARNLGVNVDSQGKIVSFNAPVPGRVLKEDETISLLKNILQARAAGTQVDDQIALPMINQEPVMVGNAADLGIKELIGRATTPFTGSPQNRIANIKNGTRFLSGQIVGPGQEFSTIKTLGTIDNSTGYLPELVIKGNRTTPEFGGGLCQVSTTLFRSVLNAGLPVTARTNHSYRVTYYEKDGEGKKIGPGLDATIYDPAPDFRFLNDTSSSILITGYVIGDKLTFELYGTKDGRVASVDGPKLLTSTPSGDPITVETDTLPPGTKKQVEIAHPGGSAIATYRVTYADGTTKEQVFKSYYRPWPAQFLLGVEKLPTDPSAPSTNTPSPTNSPTSPATNTPTNTPTT